MNVRPYQVRGPRNYQVKVGTSCKLVHADHLVRFSDSATELVRSRAEEWEVPELTDDSVSWAPISEDMIPSIPSESVRGTPS